MTIEILHFSDCPNYPLAVERVRAALQDEHVSAEIRHVPVLDAATAAAAGFPGSPTIRINGVDVEPSARGSSASGLCCRTYRGNGSSDGAPSTELIRQAIRQLGAVPEGDCCV